MGFRFRKSFKLGPFRFTASKSGISYSLGVKDARVTKRADGKAQTTLSIPGTGISHTSVSGGKPKAETQPTPAISIVEPQKVEESPRIHYDAITFYLDNTQSVNPDGKKRQDILYQFKMRRPPFEHTADLSLVSDTDTPDIMQIALNGDVVGEVPAEYVKQLDEQWDHIDGVHRIEVQGRRGTYDAYTVIRMRVE